MNFLLFSMSIILSVLSTAIMSYISMAMPIGPWIAPTLVLVAILVGRVLQIKNQSETIGIMTTAGSIGGILATGFGFSLPTLFFLDPQLFNQLMVNPLYFSFLIMIIALGAGGCGMMLANIFEHRVIDQDKLEFPIGSLVHKMISAGNQIKKSYELSIGFFLTAIFCALQDGIFGIQSLFLKSFTLISPMQLGVFSIPLVRFDLWPMVWAIGFITGHLIALPLAVGAVAKVFLINPINKLWFSNLSSVEFIFAFCSGMVLFGAFNSFIKFPKLLQKIIKSFSSDGSSSLLSNFKINIFHAVLLFFGSITSLLFFDFTVIQSLYIICFTSVFTYQLIVIAGKWGIAPLGRFATFVMLPAMVLFKLTSMQIVLVAVFVEVCGGVAVDILFGRKIARLGNINLVTVKRYQILGLIVSAMTVGAVFWLLIKTCGLGSSQLFAYKAQSRHLLINAFSSGTQFNWYVLVIGALFSLVLQFVKVNPTLVLGGLLMPLNLSLGLVFGGCLTLLVKKREDWEPFLSGVFASNSIWMILKSFM